MVLLLPIASIPPVFSQSLATGDIVGVVTDPSGAVIPHANVTLENVETNSTRTQTTNAAGAYRFSLLPPGRYTLSEEASAFRAYNTCRCRPRRSDNYRKYAGGTCSQEAGDHGYGRRIGATEQRGSLDYALQRSDRARTEWRRRPQLHRTNNAWCLDEHPGRFWQLLHLRLAVHVELFQLQRHV